MAPNPRRTVDPKTGIVKFPRYTIVSTGPISGDLDKFQNKYGTIENPSEEFVEKKFTGEFNFYNPEEDAFKSSLTTTVDDPKPKEGTQVAGLGALASLAGPVGGYLLNNTGAGANIASSITDAVTPALKPIFGNLISTGGDAAGDIVSSGTGDIVSSGTEAAGGLSNIFGGPPSSIGSSILGSGVGLVAGLLGGKSPMEAVKGAALGLAGKVIGGAVGGPVGAFIGGALFSAIGGRVICNELVRQGLLDRRSVILDYKFTRERLTPQHVNGYHVWAIHVVKRLRKGKGVKLWKHIASHRANEIAYIYGERDAPDYLGKVYRHIGEPACWLIGAFCKKTDWSILYNPKEI
jgi:hypothetical protein